MKNQSGRSMIEMLGVLAIIGVLSLGGVAVFNAAMNRQTANNLTYDVMLMAESTVSLGPQEQMPFDASTEYDQMSSVRDANGIVNVTVQDVENDICEVLLSKAGNDVFEFRDAGGNALDACADDTTDVVFAFTGDGFGGNNPVDPDENNCPIGCPDDHICVDGQCCANLIPTGVCEVAATDTCPAFKRECGAGKYCSEGECLACDLSYERCQNCGYENEDGDWIEDLDNCGIFDPATCSCLPYCDSASSAATEEECMACGDWYAWTYYPGEAERYCLPCYDLSRGYLVSEETCNACGDEYVWFEKNAGDGYCVSCDSLSNSSPGLDSWEEASAFAEELNNRGCSDVIPVWEGDGVFALTWDNNECPEPKGYGRGGIYPMSMERCSNCPSFAWSNGQCMYIPDHCGTGVATRNVCENFFGYDYCPCYCQDQTEASGVVCPLMD